MRFNFRKIASVLASAVMLGSTLGIAAAANFPAPFVSSGVADVAVVVGSETPNLGFKPASSDLTAATTISNSLDSSLAGQTTSTGGATVAGGESIQIRLTGNEFNYMDTGYGILPAGVDEADLPTLLADGRFYDNKGTNDNDETYTQTITFGESGSAGITMNLTFEADDDGNEEVGSYLRLPKKKVLYTYSIEFDESIDFVSTSAANTKADFNGVDMQVFGKEYQIVGATETSVGSGIIDTLTLMGGVATGTLDEGESTTLIVDGRNYDIKLDLVSSADEAKFIVNTAATDLLSEGDVYEVDADNDVDIGVREVVNQDYAGGRKQVTFYIGAEKIKIEAGDKVEVNDEDVDGSKCWFTSASSDLDDIFINFSTQDDIYLGSPTDGDTYTEPVFNSLSFKFGGIVADYEEMEMKLGKNDGTFTFVNKDGKTVVLPLKGNNSWLVWGKDFDELLLYDPDPRDNPGNTTSSFWDPDSTTTDDDDADGTWLFVVDNGRNAHLMQITSFTAEDSTKNKTTIKDYTYDRIYTDKEVTINANSTFFANGDTCGGTVTNLKLGSVGTVQLHFYAEGVICVPEGGLQLADGAESLNQANITIRGPLGRNNSGPRGGLGLIFQGNSEGINASVVIQEYTDKSNAAWINLTTYRDKGTDDRLEFLTAPYGQFGTDGYWMSSFIDESDSNDDITYAATIWGSILSYDAEDAGWVKIKHPAEQAYGDIFVSEPGVTLSKEGGALGGVTVEDIEVDSVSGKNLVVIGGSCINRAAARILGITIETCGADFTTATGVGANQALIKVITSPYNSAKIAMLVAGYEAEDTTRAAKYVTSESPSTDVGETKLSTATTVATVVS